MRIRFLLLLLLLLTSQIVLAHQDFWMEKDFGNVKVRIKTGFSYEEIEKSWIIGELACRLSEKLNYSQQIFIDLDHYYVGSCDPDYFLSFDDGSIDETWDEEKPKPFLKRNSLVIRQVSRMFDPAITLKLVEYSIKNVGSIRSDQKVISYDQNYCNWRINTIDTNRVKTIVRGELSQVCKAVLETRVYRKAGEEQEGNISYFFQNNKYHIFSADIFEKRETVLMSLQNIYQLENLSYSGAAIAFDTDSTFYYVNDRNEPLVSTKKTITNIEDNYRPFETKLIGSSYVTFTFDYFDSKVKQSMERTVMYHPQSDKLIQDIDAELRKTR